MKTAKEILESFKKLNETNMEDLFDEVLIELSDIVNSVNDELKIKFIDELKELADKFRKENNIKDNQ